MKTNKKFLAYFFAVVMLFSALALASCGENKTAEEDFESSEDANEAIDISSGFEAPIKLCEALMNGDITYANVEACKPKEIWEAEGLDIDSAVEIMKAELEMSLGGAPKGTVVCNIELIDYEKLGAEECEEISGQIMYNYGTELEVTEAYMTKTSTTISYGGDNAMVEALVGAAEQAQESEDYSIKINGKWYMVDYLGYFFELN